jgi:hypothetical protein
MSAGLDVAAPLIANGFGEGAAFPVATKIRGVWFIFIGLESARRSIG